MFSYKKALNIQIMSLEQGHYYYNLFVLCEGNQFHYILNFFTSINNVVLINYYINMYIIHFL